jgi:hypothetical protein
MKFPNDAKIGELPTRNRGRVENTGDRIWRKAQKKQKGVDTKCTKVTDTRYLVRPRAKSRETKRKQPVLTSILTNTVPHLQPTYANSTPNISNHQNQIQKQPLIKTHSQGTQTFQVGHGDPLLIPPSSSPHIYLHWIIGVAYTAPKRLGEWILYGGRIGRKERKWKKRVR